MKIYIQNKNAIVCVKDTVIYLDSQLQIRYHSISARRRTCTPQQQQKT